jgi:Flp pilus assembly protein TadG
MTKPKRTRGLISDRRGTTAVEFSLVMGILMFMLAGIVDFGRYFWFRSAIQEVAADASRCSAIYTSNLAFYTSQPYNYATSAVASPCSNLTTYVQNLATSRGVGVTVTPAATPACAPVISTSAVNSFNALTLTATFKSLFGLYSPSLPNISSTVCYPY